MGLYAAVPRALRKESFKFDLLCISVGVEDVKRTSALRLKVRTSSVLHRLTPATASLLPGRQHRLPGRFLSFQDWPATSFPARLKLWTENTMIDQGWPENLSPASPGRREAVLEACAVVREGEKPSPA
ncbi:hypothetical protein ACLB2K_061539 [Fragaria x ananassa]